jgi:arabinofuranosyltransferase
MFAELDFRFWLNRSETDSTTHPQTAPARLRPSAIEMAITLAFCVYAAIFILQSSFVIDGIRYFSLFDDDMVSMRYAANLAHGQGLVWNPGGEKVLGFTNPLWVLYMAAFHLLPISASKVALLIQLSGALFLILNLFVVGAVCKELAPELTLAGPIAMALTAFYNPLDNWALQGTEVSILTLIVGLAVLLFLSSTSPRSRTAVYILLGISTAIRLDMAVFSFVLLAAMTAMESGQWRRHLVLGGAIVVTFLMGQAMFNFCYYGQALPNTYFLKIAGFPMLARVRRGLVVLVLFVLPWLPIAGIMGIFGLRRSRRAWLLLAVIAAQGIYSVWVGGDAWEWYGGSNRYISLIMPLVFILIGIGIENFAAWIPKHWEFPFRGPVLSAATVTLTLLVWLSFTSTHLRESLLLVRPIQTDMNEDMVRQALMVQAITDPEASIAVVWAGAIPYFAGREAIDLLGKNDSKIARENMRLDPSLLARSFGFWPGHLKWDYDYSIGQLKPDLVLQVWAVQPQNIPALDRDYVPVGASNFTWYIRRASRHVMWPKIADLDPTRNYQWSHLRRVSTKQP